MNKVKKSGPAIFMYIVIAMMLIVSLACFTIYYGGINKSRSILLIGIIAFTIMYQFWLRLIMGNIVKLFKKHINYNQWWFKERKFEKTLYKLLSVKEWKSKALTYNPELFSLKQNSLEEIAKSMCKVEIDHWVNCLISLSMILFAIPWGLLYAFLISAILAIIFDLQFIVIQRYNRPRIYKILKNMEKNH